MDFSYREEQLEVKALAQKIIGDQTSNERQKEVDLQPARFDEKLWQDLARAGFLGVAVDEAQGGMGFDFETVCLLVEETGRTAAALPVIPALVSAALPLQRYGSERQKEILSRLVSGEALLTAALIEPANENPCEPGARADAAGDGWLLAGSKTCVPYIIQADAVLVSVQAVDELLVLLLPCARFVDVQAQHGTADEPQGHIVLDGITVSSDELVARGEQAVAMMHWMELLTRAAASAMATGLCDRMMRMTAEYTSQREQFGVPVATFQAVGHRAADCYIDVDCLRLVSQEAISRLTLGLNAEQAVTVAKIWTGDVCHRVSQAAQHLHGGIGVDRDYPLFRYCLMARQLELCGGSSARLTQQLGTHIALEYLAASGIEQSSAASAQ